MFGQVPSTGGGLFNTSSTFGQQNKPATFGFSNTPQTGTFLGAQQVSNIVFAINLHLQKIRVKHFLNYAFFVFLIGTIKTVNYGEVISK